MREALGQPLQNISKELLNKVVSKEVARDLRKYKFSLGKTPNKENKRSNNGGGERNSLSPTRRLNFGSPTRDDRSPSNSREVRDLLKELDSSVHEQVSMLKMIAVKCSDADASYKKIR
jgi:hypothetical protein